VNPEGEKGGWVGRGGFAEKEGFKPVLFPLPRWLLRQLSAHNKLRCNYNHRRRYRGKFQSMHVRATDVTK